VVDWITAAQARFDAFTRALGAVDIASPAALVALDPATLHEAADILRGTAAAQADSAPPAVAVTLNDMLVGLFTDFATSLDALADAIDAGDQPAIDTAVTAIASVTTALVTVEDSPEFADLVRTCPVVGLSA
jgi:hypothetical protein